jgi:hypothetical protein
MTGFGPLYLGFGFDTLFFFFGYGFGLLLTFGITQLES